MTEIIQKNIFEYKITSFSGVTGNQLTNEMNKLGKEGWELVSVVPESMSNYSSRLKYYFKRNMIKI